MLTQIERNGADKITLPEKMTHDEAINRLRADKELLTYGEQETTIEEVIHRFCFEGAYALAKAIEQLHGSSIAHDIQLPDGTVIHNKLIGVPISTTETVQVPWGPFHLADVEGEFETVQVVEKGMVVMKLVARVKRKYADKVKALADRTREIAEKESIYRGKAIMVKFRDKEGELEVVPPSFMDLSGDHTVIFSESVMREIKVNILVPIKYADRARQLKIPTKRGVLLVGTYGSGKTLTAHWMAKEATQKARTFIYIRDSSELGDALRLASLYGPAMIFGEDIDRVMFGLRTQAMDQVLNTVDGVDTKNLDILTVLTTNNLNMIHPAFLREGRMDTIIEIDKPDQAAADALVRHFGGKLIEKEVQLIRLVGLLQDRSPAFIREVVERSKLDKLLELGDEGDVETIRLTAQDLELAYHYHSKEREGVDDAMEEGDMIMQLTERLQERGINVRGLQ